MNDESVSHTVLRPWQGWPNIIFTMWDKSVSTWWSTGSWFNINMLSCQYRKSHCGDKTILRPSSISTMGFRILVWVWWHLYIESGPRLCEWQLSRIGLAWIMQVRKALQSISHSNRLSDANAVRGKLHFFPKNNWLRTIDNIVSLYAYWWVLCRTSNQRILITRHPVTPYGDHGVMGFGQQWLL